MGMYNLTKENKWKTIITSDEAMSYVQDENKKRDIQYIPKDSKRSTAAAFEHKVWPKGIMVWLGMSHHGLTKPIFVKPGAKINSDSNVNDVLKQLNFFATVLYLNGYWIFHQDSAPSHTAKNTIAWLNENDIKFIRPDQWMPNSPDAAPCDFLSGASVE